ncbi:MAG: hypothetical protein Kow00124_11290 [Anaerolineae bacterium]
MNHLEDGQAGGERAYSSRRAGCGIFRIMQRIKRALAPLLITCALAAGMAPAASAAPAPFQPADAYRLVDMVNALRAEYGLPPYQVNSALMVAAQLHTEWAASVGYHSHVGPDGSRPRDRAVAAGYGGGAEVFVSENIYWGTMATPESAMAWWRNSPIHFQGMTSTRYQEIGVGAAYSESGGYFTLLFGVVAGAAPAEPAPSSSGAAAPPGSASSGGGGALVRPEAIALATPGPDGAVVHTVSSGEVPINIAEAYGVDLYALLAMNGLSESSIIFPGDQLIIRPPSTPTPTPAITATPSLLLAPPSPTATARPTGSAALSSTPSAEVAALDAAAPDAKPTPTDLELAVGRRVNRTAILIALIGLGLVGGALIAIGAESLRRAA